MIKIRRLEITFRTTLNYPKFLIIFNYFLSYEFYHVILLANDMVIHYKIFLMLTQ